MEEESMGRFDGRTALVTGAASGIGAATARQLAREGAHVLVADINDPSGVAQETGGEPIHLDVADAASWENALAGRTIDLGVLNAGVGARFTDLLELDPHLVRNVMNVNVDGVIIGTKELARAMAGRPGAISVTASIAGVAAHTQSPVYGASKWAVLGWVRAIAPALSERNITINAVCPGLVDTPILGPGGGDLMRSMGMNMLDADEVAQVHADVLAGDTTGEVLIVQAGRVPSAHTFAGVEGYQG
jgi:NAD(P)-dependent dehydrogenase (short-subunit alcohol dehydrogenase family)